MKRTATVSSVVLSPPYLMISQLSLHVHIDLLFILLEQRTIETLRRDIMLKRSFNITIIFSCFIYCVALYDVTGRNIWRISLLFFTDHCILFLYICDAELRKENLYYVVLDLGVRTTVPEIDHYYTLHSHSHYMLLQYKC